MRLLAVLASLLGSWFSNKSHAKFEAANWMRDIDGEMFLDNLTLPGTHDSAADNCGDFFTCFAAGFVETQDHNVGQQLRLGVRALDIRLRHIGDNFTLHHGVVYLNKDFDDVLAEVRAFLAASPSEVVLMRLREEHQPHDVTRSFVQTLKSYVDKYVELFWLETRVPRLGEVRGRVVVLRDFDTDFFFRPGIDWDQSEVQDNWKANLTEKWSDVKSSLLHAGWTNRTLGSQLHINFVSKSPTDARDVAWYSDRLNPRLGLWLKRSAQQGRRLRGLGVIFMDFPPTALLRQLIRFNR